ncbi:MAG TPA: glycerate kinase [Thermofilum sp.]|nr:MAG: glycerate kinase [Thermoprotei archaeon]HDI31516.1 glycerate kinase [Thermofilum sp.]
MESSNERARKVALTLVLEGIEAADPLVAIKRFFEKEGNELVIKKVKGDVYVVGAGKATGGMAKAVEEVLGDRIKAGIIAVPEELVNDVKLSKIKVLGSTHPKASEKSVRAGKEIVNLVKNASEEDLVIALFSGGGSALVEYPVNGVSIEDIGEVSIALMNAGADIFELNTVRKHLSLFKGGWLAKHASPSSMLCLMISDVVGDRMDTIASGPTVPDPTTFKDALKVLKKYKLYDKAPRSVISYIEKGVKNEVPETPKPGDPIFKRVINRVVASNIISLNSMRRKASELGYNALILTSMLEGEAREVGKVIAGIAKEVKASGNPIPPPAVILAGGETTVTVRGKGRGGRNQELALSAALTIENLEGIAIASVGSDGRDGPTDAAGAIVDGTTAIIAKKRGLDPYIFLAENNSYEFFKAVGGHVTTGYTGTNVNDLIVIVVEKSS